MLQVNRYYCTLRPTYGKDELGKGLDQWRSRNFRNANAKYNPDGREKFHWTKLHRLDMLICSSETEPNVAKKLKTKLSNPNPVKQNLKISI